jgi:hypothetical protein
MTPRCLTAPYRATVPGPASGPFDPDTEPGNDMGPNPHDDSGARWANGARLLEGPLQGGYRSRRDS